VRIPDTRLRVVCGSLAAVWLGRQVVYEADPRHDHAEPVSGILTRRMSILSCRYSWVPSASASPGGVDGEIQALRPMGTGCVLLVLDAARA